MGDFCSDSLTYYPIDKLIPGLPPNDVGLFMILAGLLYLVMSVITILWIKNQEYIAQTADSGEEAAKSVIFPIFVKLLWCNIVVNTFGGIVITVFPINPVGTNDLTTALTYATLFALQHVIIEGTAFLFMQKGCGNHAAIQATKYASIWGVISFVMIYYTFHLEYISGTIVECIWDGIMVVFYTILWFAPAENLYRRPAAIYYSKFWGPYRLLAILINILFFFNATEMFGSCGYLFLQLFLFAILQPLICYWSLLIDSRWWQGIVDNENDYHIQSNRIHSYEQIRTPLLGADFSLTTAQSLANTMDTMHVYGQVKMLNFACIKINFQHYLGGGSFSKVYQGSYHKKTCAIKLICTVDLTQDMIRRVAAEASILSSIRHPNIVHIYGVSVLPPSVCLILEICSFGSLSDIIRGYGFNWNATSPPQYPLTLHRYDLLYLALGCARGLAAVHAYDETICHRDVKSFNFLVDHQFNVKIADLELGVADQLAQQQQPQPPPVNSQLNTFPTTEEDDDHLTAANTTANSGPNGTTTGVAGIEVQVEMLLPNWMAPEVIKERRYQQASDIYALGTVFWEIISKQLPFQQQDNHYEIIRQMIIDGYQHPLPISEENTIFGKLIKLCWSYSIHDRPTANEIVMQLEYYLNHIEITSLSLSSSTEVQREEREEAVIHANQLLYPYLNMQSIYDYYEMTYRKTLYTIVPTSKPSMIRSSMSSQDVPIDYLYPPNTNTNANTNTNTNSSKKKRKKNAKTWVPSLSSLFNPHATTMKRRSNHYDPNYYDAEEDDDLDDEEDDRECFLLEDISDDEEDILLPTTTTTNTTASTAIHIHHRGLHHYTTYPIYSHHQITSNPTSSCCILPESVLQLIRCIKEEAYWISLQQSQSAWMVMTSEPPYIILHGTSYWYELFQLSSSTMGYDYQLLSLYTLLSPEWEAMNSSDRVSYSNTFVQEATCTPHTNHTKQNKHANKKQHTEFHKMRKTSAKRLLDGLAQYQTIHGILNLHLPRNQIPPLRPSMATNTTNNTTSTSMNNNPLQAGKPRDNNNSTSSNSLLAYLNQGQGHNQSQSQSLLNPQPTSHSISRGSTSNSTRIRHTNSSLATNYSTLDPQQQQAMKLIGHNMMCSIHAFPIFSPLPSPPPIITPTPNTSPNPSPNPHLSPKQSHNKNNNVVIEGTFDHDDERTETSYASSEEDTVISNTTANTTTNTSTSPMTPTAGTTTAKSPQPQPHSPLNNNNNNKPTGGPISQMFEAYTPSRKSFGARKSFGKKNSMDGGHGNTTTIGNHLQSKPLYYLVLFNELKEETPHPPQQPAPIPSSSSSSVSSHQHQKKKTKTMEQQPQKQKQQRAAARVHNNIKDIEMPDNNNHDEDDEEEELLQDDSNDEDEVDRSSIYSYWSISSLAKSVTSSVWSNNNNKG